MKWLLCFFAIVFYLDIGSTSAQFKELDARLIEKNNFLKPEFERRKVNFLFIGESPLLRYNPVSLTLGGLMYIYQKIISPQFSANCGYEISCSNFSKKAILEFGLIKGIALTADRLTRCSPYAAIDINPVFISSENKVIDNLEKYR